MYCFSTVLSNVANQPWTDTPCELEQTFLFFKLIVSDSLWYSKGELTNPEIFLCYFFFPWRSKNLSQKFSNRFCLPTHFLELSSKDSGKPWLAWSIQNLPFWDEACIISPKNTWLCREEWTLEQIWNLLGGRVHLSHTTFIVIPLFLVYDTFSKIFSYTRSLFTKRLTKTKRSFKLIL
jgi:hypothetical protein